MTRVMKYMSVTIYDVAKKAGVSIATVSYVVNNSSKPISEKTRKKVWDAVKQLQYEPSAIARGLATSKMNTICVLIDDVTNPFFSGVVRGIEEVVGSEYFVYIVDVKNASHEAEFYVQMMKKHRVSGVVAMAPIMSTETAYELMTEGMAMVLLDRRDLEFPVPCINVDRYTGLRKIIDHLISVGHRRIGLIDNAFQYREYFQETLEEKGLEFCTEWVVDGKFLMNASKQEVIKLAEAGQMPQALVALSDLMAIGAIMGLDEKGFSVPHDICVTGFDDIEFAKAINPPLTTLRVDRRRVGILAAILLLRQLAGEELEKTYFEVKPQLVIRRSSLPGGRMI